jgi:hypothetical protein
MLGDICLKVSSAFRLVKNIISKMKLNVLAILALIFARPALHQHFA